MTSIDPKVSVVISIWNGERYVTEAISSILDQTFQDFELIVIDDDSEDQTAQIIQEIKNNKIVFGQITHSGLTKALNEGFHLARGEYIARMDVDDIALPRRLEKQVQFLEAHPQVGVVGTDYEVILESGERQKPRVPLLISDFEIRQALPKFNPFFHGSVMIKRELLAKAGFYDEQFVLAQDYDLWFRLAKYCEFANLPEVLMLRREGQQTLKKEARQNWFAIQARVKAIREKNSNFWNVIYILRPLLVAIAPIWLKIVIRKIFFGNDYLRG